MNETRTGGQARQGSGERAILEQMPATEAPAGGPTRLPRPGRAELVLAAAAGLFAYTAVRAWKLSFTHDESATYTRFVGQPLGALLRYDEATANHHVVNTLAMKAADAAVGSSELALRAGPLAACAVYLAVLTVQFLVPFFLGGQLSATPGAIGMVMIAFPLTAALAGPVSGWAADRWSARAVAAAGATLLTVALTAFAALSARWEAGIVAVLLAMVGVGFGLFLTANQALALAVVPDSRIGLATASTNLARVVGLAAGPAVATATWAATGYAISGMRLALVIAAAASGAAALALVLARVPGGLQQSSVRDRGPAPSSNPARSS